MLAVTEDKKGLSSRAGPKASRVYIDEAGWRVHRVVRLTPDQISSYALRVEYATLWAVGPYSPVIIIPNRHKG
jgi:hypothetical protein